ncbi:rhodanese-like domain-containing protein [Nonomuraea fuscirosea]|uniref:rhodanese-like domain-containing protein n=1 Tax=Nonomuraea fuscirosea TaxID=1291556 RepID=UPI002DD97978|nr:rhodanese-like domain-containing protein [Nonomuraea fuscirosea]WSA50995.1 rhodanese-like domain-containing protein [Nonomuraea fuscirosea]
MELITREDLLALLESGGVQLVEALPADAFNAEHLPGARNVTDRVSAELAEQVAPDRAAPVVVYCSGPYCNRSKIAAAAFARLGYAEVRVYAGGKEDWAQAGLAFEGNRANTPTTASTISGAAAAAGRPS